MGLENFNDAVQWSKFKKVNAGYSGGTMDAETVTEYKASSIKAGRKGNAAVYVSATVKIFVNTHRSWAVRGRTTDELLKHEQGHFDISALAARSFFDGLLSLSAPDTAALETAMQKLNDDMQTKIDDTNKRYDTQTNHSRNKTEQDKWNKAIEAEKRNAYRSLDNLPL